MKETFLDINKKIRSDYGIAMITEYPFAAKSSGKIYPFPELEAGELGIITGFTGAGKTSVLKKMQEWNQGKNTILHHLSLAHVPELDMNEIKRLVKTATNQSIIYFDDMHIVMGNGSRSHFFEDIRKLATKYKKVIWVTHQANRSFVNRSNLNLDSFGSMYYSASAVVYAISGHPYIVGEIIKNRYGHKGMMVNFGRI